MPSLADLEALKARYDELVILTQRIQVSLSQLTTSEVGPNEVELAASVERAISSASAIRGEASRLFEAAESAQGWKGPAEFEAAFGAVRAVLIAKEASAVSSVVGRLAGILAAGRVAHHLQRVRERLDGLRQRAESELRAAAASQLARPLPGPQGAANWLDWFWAAGDSVEQSFDELLSAYPALADFLESVTRDQWQPGVSIDAKPAKGGATGEARLEASPAGGDEAVGDAGGQLAQPRPHLDAPDEPAAPAGREAIVASPDPGLGAGRDAIDRLSSALPQSAPQPGPPAPPASDALSRLEGATGHELGRPEAAKWPRPDQASGDAANAPAPGIPPVVPQPAERIEGVEGPDVRSVIWGLVGAGRAGLAFQIAAAWSGLGQAEPVESADLFRATALAPFVRSSFGEVVDGFRSCVAELTAQAGLPGAGDESTLARRLILFGVSVRPALLAPATGAASVLQAIHSLDGLCPAIGAVRQAVLGFGAANLELSPSVLKGVRDHARWDERLRRLRDDVRGWLESNRQAKIIFAAATTVWQLWLRDDGPLGRPLRLVIDDQRDARESVREAVGVWSEVRNFEKMLARTDKEIRGTGARRRPIEARAKTELGDRTQEFVRLAGDWLDHIAAEPRSLDDYRQRRADQVREEVQQALPEALEEVDRVSGSGGVDVVLPPAVRYVRWALRDLQSLFDPSREEAAETPPARIILGEELLGNPRLDMTEDWMPAGPATVESFRLIFDLAKTPYDAEQAFRSQAEMRDHVRTGYVIEALRVRGGDAELGGRLQEERGEQLRLCRGTFQQELARTRAAIERAVCYDLISGDDRNRCSETVEWYAAGLEDLLDFGRAWADLRQIEVDLESRYKARVALVDEKLAALLREGVPDDRRGDIEIIKAALGRNDFLSAEEYLELVRHKQPLTSQAIEPTRQVLREFFAEADSKSTAGFAQRFDGFMEGREGRPKPQPRELLEKIKAAESVGPIDMQGVPLPQAKEAGAMLEAWFQLKQKSGKADIHRELAVLLAGFGFKEAKAESATLWKHPYWLAVCRTAVLNNPNVCIIPYYGSLAKGKYRVLGVYDRPDEDSLVDLLKDVPGAEPLLVLWFGRMTERRRRDLAEFCWERGRGFLTIDESLVYFLCGERYNRLPILFQCSLPFTVAKPYTTTASLVPIEMFFGRQQERQQVIDPYGPNLVYGGRQLGKSALLRDVERREHNLATGSVVRWIDLKNRGVGIDRPIEDLWAEIGQELHQAGVLARAVTTAATVIERVKDWLEAENGRRILLLLDEADAFLDADSQQVHPKTRHSFPEVSRLKGLMDDTSRRFKVVFAGLHNVQRAARDPNTPVGHLGTPVCIGPLLDRGEWRQARDLIEVPLRHMGYELNPPDLWMRILSYTNYYPSLIQVFCKHLLEYLHNKDRTSFDFRRCPPYPVNAEQIEQVYQSETLQGEIRHKFELTLGLDPRYRLIALRIALDSLDNVGGRADGVAVDWVRGEALSLWPEGFSAEDRSYELYRTILDEMVGFGVLRKAGEDKYALRSPNVLNLLGSKDQIDMKLMDVMAMPPAPVYVAASLRRSFAGDQWSRSPLTAEQEATLTEAANGVTVVFGSRLSGLDRLPEGRRAIPNLAGVESAGRMASPTQFEAWLRHADKNREPQAEGVTLAVVDQSSGWTADWVRRAADFLGPKTASRKRFLRVVFVADPQAAWELLADEEAHRLGGGTEIALRPWHGAALRRWMEDVEFGDAHRVCEAIVSELGGWPLLVNEFVRCGRENPHNWQATLREVRGRWPQAAEWSGCIDIPADALRCLAVMVEWGKAIAQRDLDDLIGPSVTRRVLAWADRFAFILPTGDDTEVKWMIDPVFNELVPPSDGG